MSFWISASIKKISLILFFTLILGQFGKYIRNIWKVLNLALQKFGIYQLDRSYPNKLLHRVKVERNNLQTMKRRGANWIGGLMHRNCFIEHVIEGKTERSLEVTGKRRKLGKQLLGHLKERIVYWKLKEETLNRTRCRTAFGNGNGTVLILWNE